MSDILGIASAAAGGGLFGVLGSLINRGAGFFERRQRFAQEQARWEHERALHTLNMQARAKETEREIDLAQVKGNWEGLSTSLQAEASLDGGYTWVNAVRALVRPVLTLILVLISAIFYLHSGDKALLNTLAFDASAVVLWWFGDRARRDPPTMPQHTL